MKYQSLTPEEQTQILSQRLKQYEAEHFQHSVNKELLAASGATDDTTTAAIAEADESLAVLDKAHKQVAEKLAALAGEAKPAAT